MQFKSEDHVQGAAVGDYTSTLHMVFFRLKITASVVNVKYRLMILFQKMIRKKMIDNEQTKLTIQTQVT